MFIIRWLSYGWIQINISWHKLVGGGLGVRKKWKELQNGDEATSTLWRLLVGSSLTPSALVGLFHCNERKSSQVLFPTGRATVGDLFGFFFRWHAVARNGSCTDAVAVTVQDAGKNTTKNRRRFRRFSLLPLASFRCQPLRLVLQQQPLHGKGRGKKSAVVETRTHSCDVVTSSWFVSIAFYQAPLEGQKQLDFLHLWPSIIRHPSENNSVSVTLLTLYRPYTKFRLPLFAIVKGTAPSHFTPCNQRF